MYFEAREVTKSFGALIALRGVSLAVEEGEVLAILGPNGAGKTTLFNLMAGVFPPTTGSLHFRGRDVTGMSPHALCHLGVARSFQITNIFQGLTVQENVRLASQGQERKLGLFGAVTRLSRPYAEARRILELLELWEHRDTLAGNLSHGDQRYLEIGIALASRPQLLLLDEPTAGMTPSETRVTIDLIQELRKHVTIVLVEHDMDLVFEVADRILVMNQGAVLTQGAPQDVRDDPLVQAAYFGSEDQDA